MGQSSSVPIQQQHHQQQQQQQQQPHYRHKHPVDVVPNSSNNSNKDAGGRELERERMQSLQTPKATTALNQNSNNVQQQPTVKIPSAWKDTSNKQDFIMISPQSDISNPSHFRGLLHYNNKSTSHSRNRIIGKNAGSQNGRMTQPLLQSSSSNTNKKSVAKASTPSKPAFVKNNMYSSKNRYHIHTQGPPIPTKFYFHSNRDDDSDNNNDGDANVKIVFKSNDEINKRGETKEYKVAEDHQKQLNSSKSNRNVLSSKQKFAAKCKKAQQQLSECWNTTMTKNDDAFDNQRPRKQQHSNVVRHYSQRSVVVLPPPLVAGDQVDPIAKNTPKDRVSIVSNNLVNRVNNDPKTIHAIENHLESNNSNTATTTTFQPVWKEAKMIISPPPLFEPKRLSSELSDNNKIAEVPTGRVREIVRTFSHDTNTTNQTNGTFKSTATVSTVVQKPRNQLLSQTVQVPVPAGKMSESIFRPSTATVSYRPSITVTNTMSTSGSGSSSGDQTRSTVVQQPINRKSKSSTQAPQNQRKRASIQKYHRRSSATSASSRSSDNSKTTKSNHDIYDLRRDRISLDVQRQIDRQLSDPSSNVRVDHQMEQKIYDHQKQMQQQQKEPVEETIITVSQQLPTDKEIVDAMKTAPTVVLSKKSVAELRIAFETKTLNTKIHMPHQHHQRNASSVPNRLRDQHSFVENTSNSNVINSTHVLSNIRDGHMNSITTVSAKSNSSELRNPTLNYRHHDYRRRSISVPPPTRPTINDAPKIEQSEAMKLEKKNRRATITDQSALLVLSKSWDATANKNNGNADVSKNIVLRKQHQSLPVLLQMAGWKQPKRHAKKTSMTPSRRSCYKENIVTKNKNIHSSTTGEIVEPSKPTIEIKSATKTTDEVKVKSAPAKYNISDQGTVKLVTKKKAKSLDKYDHLSSTKPPTTTIRASRNAGSHGTGRTIAYMLQQAYFGNDDYDNDENKENRPYGDGNKKNTGNFDALVSPAGSNSCITIDSSSTTPNSQVQPSLLPVVSDQALRNSNFLFDQDGFTCKNLLIGGDAGSNKNDDDMLLLYNQPHDEPDPSIVESTNGTTIPSEKHPSYQLSTIKSRSRMTTRLSLSSRNSNSINSKFEQQLQNQLIVRSTVVEDQVSKANVYKANSIQSSRRVRFSEESLKPTENKENHRVSTGTTATSTTIETKMSDLTDASHALTGVATYPSLRSDNSNNVCTEGSGSVTGSIPRIDSIPEDNDGDINDVTPIKDKKQGNEKTESYQPMIRWTYRTSTASTASSSSSTNNQNGVTPLLDNRSGKLDSSNFDTNDSVIANKSRTTSSPYLRFKQAKERFASGVVLMTNTKKKVMSPLQQKFATRGVGRTTSSPIKNATSTFASRLSAFERAKVLQESQRNYRGHFVRCSSGSSTTIDLNNKQAATTTTLSASMNSIPSTFNNTPYLSSSPMLIDGQVVASPSSKMTSLVLDAINNQTTATNSRLDESSVVSHDSDDVFGAILHPTTIDDDNDDDDNFNEPTITESCSNAEDTNIDELDRLLNCTENELLSNMDDCWSSTYISLRDQKLDTLSVVSTVSSTGDTAAIPHWLLQDGGNHRSSVATVMSDTSSVLSAVGRMKSINNGVLPPLLPFREVAPVKPSEQPAAVQCQHPAPPGKLVVDPPRTWRKLAVAAQKEDMKQHHVQLSQTLSSSSKENEASFSTARYQHNANQHFIDRSNMQ